MLIWFAADKFFQLFRSEICLRVRRNEPMLCTYMSVASATKHFPADYSYFEQLIRVMWYQLNGDGHTKELQCQANYGAHKIESAVSKGKPRSAVQGSCWSDSADINMWLWEGNKLNVEVVSSICSLIVTTHKSPIVIYRTYFFSCITLVNLLWFCDLLVDLVVGIIFMNYFGFIYSNECK